MIDKLTMLKTMVGITDNTQDEALNVYLSLAKNKILQRIYPYDATKDAIPTKYEVLQCEIACYLWNKRGAEGEVVHNENGVNRSYESADIPESMLVNVLPYAGVVQ